jgi:hypothetical protein
MGWHTINPVGSWVECSADDPAELDDALQLDGSWRWYVASETVLVRKDQVGTLLGTGTPVIDSLVPDNVPAGDQTPRTTVAVLGSSFRPDDVVNFDSDFDMPTTYVSATELRFDIGPHDYPEPYPVYVHGPYAARVSNVVHFTFTP